MPRILGTSHTQTCKNWREACKACLSYMPHSLVNDFMISVREGYRACKDTHLLTHSTLKGLKFYPKQKKSRENIKDQLGTNRKGKVLPHHYT